MFEKTLNLNKRVILLRSLFIAVMVASLIFPCFSLAVSAAGQQPWNYEDYIYNIDYADGYNKVLVEIPQSASWLMVRFRDDSGRVLWSKQAYGTLLKGQWPSNYYVYDGYFDPIDSMRPLEVSNVPSGSTIRVQMRLSGFNYDYPVFNMGLYYLDDDFNTLAISKQSVQYNSSGAYNIEFEIVKPEGTRYVCVLCYASAIFPDTVGGDFQIEFTRTQLVMSIDALYMQQQVTQKNNALLEEIKKDQQIMNDKLDSLPGEIGDEMQNVIENEKQESASSGNDFVDQILDSLPDPSVDVLAALKGLTDATSYTGTDAVLPIPAIVLPGIEGLFPETTVWGGTDLDFGEYLGFLPPALLTLVQSLFTIAIVLFCVYELKGIISYCLTLRENKGG